jgi:cytochrome c oxidase subunit II
VAGTDLTILIAYGVAVVVAIAVTLGIGLSTRNRRTIDPHRFAEFEKRWLLIVAVVLVALLAGTIWFTPYGKSTPSDAQVVTVGAQQFFWRLTPSKVHVNRPVAFVTRSADVNHGFGIYKGHKFIAQIQVVPGKSSTLFHTFGAPGKYTVLCLEFCGVGHQKMTASFEVTS